MRKNELDNLLSAQDHDLIVKLREEVKWLRWLVITLYPFVLTDMGIKLFGGR